MPYVDGMEYVNSKTRKQLCGALLEFPPLPGISNNPAMPDTSAPAWVPLSSK
jgi:hypothetical protein